VAQVRIDKDNVLRLLQEVVAEKGSEYVYELYGMQAPRAACVNVAGHGDERRPVCIVGYALARAGITMQQFDDLGIRGAGATTTLSLLRGEDLLEIDKPAALALRIAQTNQDRGKTWGQSYDAAQDALYAYIATDSEL
jgi:hypothetical protein